MPVIKNTVVMYAKVKTPSLEYQKEAVKDKPWMNKEYTVDVLVDEPTYKKLKKSYKIVKAVKEALVLDSDEFKEKFKFDAPDGFANEDGELFIVKFRKKAYYNDGNEGFAPQVVGVKNRKFDNKGEKVVGADIGNGTEAHIQFKERTWDNKFGKGLALDLQAVCVTNLIRYESAGGELEFDFEEDDELEFEADSADSSEGSTEDSKQDDTQSDDGW